MYDYKKFGIDVLTSSLKTFEAQQTNNISSEAMDLIWDITIRTTMNNKRIKRVLGRYYPKHKLIELFPTRFDNNLLAYKDTILHELAHHITGVLYEGVDSHGPEWRRVCMVIGADPSATKDMSDYHNKWRQCCNTGYYKQYLIN